MKNKINSSLEEKRKILFFLKASSQAGDLKNKSLISKTKKEIAREIGILNKNK